jgi:hypothetical protein
MELAVRKGRTPEGKRARQDRARERVDGKLCGKYSTKLR